MGGFAEARRIHDLALQAGIPVWCGGMLEAGVGRAHILDGRVPHALLLEFFTREGIGTMITATGTAP